MTTQIRISGAIPCGDDQLSQAKILMGLDAARIAFEEAIEKVSGNAVTIDMRAVRHKTTAPVAAAPLVAPAPMEKANGSASRDAGRG